MSMAWITNELGHIRLAQPAVAADLPAPATPAVPGDPWASPEWATARVASLEGQRQVLHEEWDAALRDLSVGLVDQAAAIVRDDTVNRLRNDLCRSRNETQEAWYKIDRLKAEIDETGEEVERLNRENLRLRAHLAAAGLALDGLTARVAGLESEAGHPARIGPLREDYEVKPEPLSPERQAAFIADVRRALDEDPDMFRKLAP